jgi:hypothetical protein
MSTGIGILGPLLTLALHRKTACRYPVGLEELGGQIPPVDEITWTSYTQITNLISNALADS